MIDRIPDGWPRRAALWAAGAGGVAAAVGLALVLHLDLAGAASLMLAVVALLALFAGLATSLVFSAIALAILAFAFVEPRFSLQATSGEDLRALVVFVLASALVATLIYYVRTLSERQRKADAGQRRGEQAFFEEAQRLSQTGSLAWNVTTGEVVWSDETYRICGVDRSTQLSLAFLLERLHPDDRAGFQASVQAAVKNRGRFDREIRFTRDDGQHRVLHMLGHFLAEQPDQFVGALNDVTERRANEEALRNSELRYRNVFRAMAVSFWELDFLEVGNMVRKLRKSGVADLPAYFAANPAFVRDMMRATRVLDVNDYAVMLQGRGDKTEMLGNVEPFWPEASTAVYAASVIAAISGRPSFAAETRMKKIDGSEFEAHFTASFPHDGIASGKLLIGIIDISERVSAQEELRRVQSEFAHAARLSTLGELAASIAHEVNQPLAAIATNASAGLRWLDRPEPNIEEVRTLATRISADARRAADIISRVRGMAMRREAEKAPLSLAAAIEEAAAFLRHDMQAQKVTLQTFLAPGLPQVLGDRTQIQQVVVNLAMNAAQAMAQGGSAIRRVLISAEHDGDFVAVTVDDTGPGIPATDFERLFQSFFTTKESGMGIGLPICRSIVEAHGGRLSAENRPEGGARFRFTLPANQTG
jgi:signal transduction histidine kinase